MVERGRFIVFEGGEASGKSTQARLLAEHLGAKLTREPGGSPIAERIRSLLLDPELEHLDSRAELLLMMAARADHVTHVISPALASGCDVVCDRFSGSTLAYQGFGRGLPLDEVEAACELAADGVAEDLVILLDVPPELARQRLQGRPDRIEREGESFHDRVRKGFRSIAAERPQLWVTVDGSGTAEAVFDAVLDEVNKRFAPGSGSIAR